MVHKIARPADTAPERVRPVALLPTVPRPSTTPIEPQPEVFRIERRLARQQIAPRQELAKMREQETAPMPRALGGARTEAQGRAHWRTAEHGLRQRTPPIAPLRVAQAPAQRQIAPEALRHPPPIAHPQAEEPVLQPTGVVATCRRPATVPVRPLRDRRLEPAALHPAAVPSA